MDIVVDFDGTCVTHAYPKIGHDIGAAPVLREIVANGHNLILFTMRSNMKDIQKKDKSLHFAPGVGLTEAVNWFNENGIPLYGIQRNPTQDSWTESPKAYGSLIIDDAALGCPLKFDESISDRPFVDWEYVRLFLVQMKLIS